jgi:hypothetical protein
MVNDKYVKSTINNFSVLPVTENEETMTSVKNVKHEKSLSAQSQRFIETARALECDEDKDRFEERLRKIAKAPIKPKPPKRK